jgi:hypothetical protein
VDSAWDAAPETGHAMPAEARAAAAAQGLLGVGHAYELTAVDGNGNTVAPTMAYTTSVQFSAHQASSVDAATMALYWWNGALWHKEATSRVDLATHTVTAQPTHLSLWAVFVTGDPPSFTKGPDQVVPVDAGPQRVEHWATDLSVPIGQEYGFLVSADHKELFDVWPDVDNAGTLTYTPKAGVSGRTTVTIYLAYGIYPDITESAHQTFTITIGSIAKVYLPFVLR